MKFTVEINMITEDLTNSEVCWELSHAFRKLADSLDNTNMLQYGVIIPQSWGIRDINGNKIGTAEIE